LSPEALPLVFGGRFDHINLPLDLTQLHLPIENFATWVDRFPEMRHGGAKNLIVLLWTEYGAIKRFCITMSTIRPRRKLSCAKQLNRLDRNIRATLSDITRANKRIHEASGTLTKTLEQIALSSTSSFYSSMMITKFDLKGGVS